MSAIVSSLGHLYATDNWQQISKVNSVISTAGVSHNAINTRKSGVGENPLLELDCCVVGKRYDTTMNYTLLVASNNLELFLLEFGRIKFKNRGESWEYPSLQVPTWRREATFS